MQEFVNTVFDKQINPKYQNNRKLITFVLKKILKKVIYYIHKLH